MTIRKPVVSNAAWVIASIASTSALGQTAPEASNEAVEVEEIVVTGSRIARSDFSSTSPIVTYSEEAMLAQGEEPIIFEAGSLPAPTSWPGAMSASSRPGATWSMPPRASC